MKKFLWDIDIEQLQLGWEDVYQNAYENFPNGTVIKNCFFHPVEYQAQLLAYFHTYQTKAKSTHEQLQKNFDRELLNLLATYDRLLYSVLYEWLDDERDISQFNSSDLDRRLEDTVGYMLSADAELSFMQPYKKLQLIQMDFDKLH